MNLKCLFVCLIAAASCPALQISFTDAVSKAAQAAPSVQKAQQDVMAAQSGRLKVLSEMGPQFQMNLNMRTSTNTLLDITAGGEPVFGAQVNTGANVTITQPLSPLIAQIQQFRAQSSAVDASKWSLNYQRANATFEMAALYRRVQQLEQLTRVANDRVAAVGKQKKDSELQMNLGKISKADALRVAILFNQAKVDQASADSDYRVGLAMLKKALAMDEVGMIELDPFQLDAMTTTFSVPTLEEATEQALQGRFELKAAEKVRDSLALGQALPFAAYLPSVDTYLRWSKQLSDAGPLVPSSDLEYGLRASWNFWDNGANIFSYRQALAQTNKAQVDARDMRNTIRLDIEQKWNALVLAQQVFELRKTSYEQATLAFKAISIKFSVGAVSVTDYLLSEALFHQSRVDFVGGSVNLDVARMQLEQAMGQDTPSSLLSPKNPGQSHETQAL